MGETHVRVNAVSNPGDKLKAFETTDTNGDDVKAQAVVVTDSTGAEVAVGASLDSIKVAAEATATALDVASSTRASEETLAAVDAKLNSLGQKTMAGSVPVVIASDQALSVTGTFTPAAEGATGDPAPASTEQIGGPDSLGDLQAARTYDLDSGVAEEHVLGVSLRASASGGSVELGTALNPLSVAVVSSTGGGLTDAELRATPVPVSDGGGSLTVDGPLTDAQLRAAAVPVSGPLTDGQLRAAAVPVSAAALPLPAGASTEATLAAIKAKTDNIDVLLSSRTKPADSQHVTVDNASIAVTGALTDAQLRATAVPVSGPLTDAQLRAAAVPISAAAIPLPAGAATDAGLAAIYARLADGTQVVADGGGSITVDGPITDAQLRAAAVPVSAAALPLPAGAATDATMATLGTEATLALIKAKTDNIDVALSTRTKPADSQHVTVDNASVAVTGPLTDAQLRAAAVPVSGPLTDAQLRASVVPVGDGGGSITVDAAALPLPTGASTEATLATMLLDATFTGRINTQGQKTMALSTPVVIASNQSALTVAGQSSTGAPLFGFPVTTSLLDVAGNIQIPRVFDVDSGAGTQYAIGVSLRKAAAGGSVEAATAADPLRVDPTGTTAQPITDGGGSITVDGPLTDTQLRATPVPISGTVTTGGLTDTQLRATAVPISAAALPLPAGAAQEHATAVSPSSSRLSDGAAFYDAAKTGQLPAALVGGRLDENVGAWLGSTAPTVGQKTMANSLPVTLASDQAPDPVTVVGSFTSPTGGTVTLDLKGRTYVRYHMAATAFSSAWRIDLQWSPDAGVTWFSGTAESLLWCPWTNGDAGFTATRSTQLVGVNTSGVFAGRIAIPGGATQIRAFASSIGTGSAILTMSASLDGITELLRVTGREITTPIEGVLVMGADGTSQRFLKIDTSGRLNVVGAAASDSPVAGNPVLVAGRASAAAPGDVSLDGNAVSAWYLRNGAAATVLTAAGALIGGDAANGLDVDITRVPAPLNVVGGGVEATALRVTLASDSTGLLSVDDNGASLTVDSPGVPTALGQSTMANSMRVVVASDQTALQTVGAAAAGAAVSGNPVAVGISDGTNVQRLRGDAAGRIEVVQPTPAWSGAYAVSVRQTAASLAGVIVWGLLNTDAAKVVHILGIQLQMFFDGAAAATLMKYELVKYTGCTAMTTGTAVTALEKRTSLAPVSTCKVLDTGIAQSSGAAQAVIPIGAMGRVTQTTTNFADRQRDILGANPRSPFSMAIELAQNELLAIRPSATCVIGDNIVGYVEVAEV